MGIGAAGPVDFNSFRYCNKSEYGVSKNRVAAFCKLVTKSVDLFFNYQKIRIDGSICIP